MRLVILATLGWISFLVPSVAQNQKQYAIHMEGTSLAVYCRSYLEFVRAGMRGDPQLGYESAQCRAYVLGVLDTISIEEIDRNGATTLDICRTLGVPSSILVEVVAKYIDDNPSDHVLSGYLLTRKAISTSYAC